MDSQLTTSSLQASKLYCKAKLWQSLAYANLEHIDDILSLPNSDSSRIPDALPDV